MNLSFSQIWPERMGTELAGKPNYFVSKIWRGLRENEIIPSHLQIYENYHIDIQRTYGINPKLHTIRKDKNDRWKTGNKIHFVINNRTIDRFQFGPVIRCVSVQNIQIIHQEDPDYLPIINTGNKWLCYESIEQLAINDGFPSVDAFFKFFDSDFKGKIIHWTELKY